LNSVKISLIQSQHGVSTGKILNQSARSVAANPISIKIIEEGPVRVAVEVVRENEGSKITQRIDFQQELTEAVWRWQT
jgi:hypothetical protein